MLLACKDESRHWMGIGEALRWRDTYGGDLVHNGIELLQCLEERRNPIHETNRIGADDGGRCALDAGRSDNVHLRVGILCGFKLSGCLYSRVVWGIELVEWDFLFIQIRICTKAGDKRTLGMSTSGALVPVYDAVSSGDWTTMRGNGVEGLLALACGVACCP